MVIHSGIDSRKGKKLFFCSLKMSHFSFLQNGLTIQYNRNIKTYASRTKKRGEKQPGTLLCAVYYDTLLLLTGQCHNVSNKICKSLVTFCSHIISTLSFLPEGWKDRI